VDRDPGDPQKQPHDLIAFFTAEGVYFLQELLGIVQGGEKNG